MWGCKAYKFSSSMDVLSSNLVPRKPALARRLGKKQCLRQVGG